MLAHPPSLRKASGINDEFYALGAAISLTPMDACGTPLQSWNLAFQAAMPYVNGISATGVNPFDTFLPFYEANIWAFNNGYIDADFSAAATTTAAAAAAYQTMIEETQEAAQGLVDYWAIKSTPFSTDCEAFLTSLGTSGAALKNAAANVQVIDGSTSTFYYADLYMYTPALQSVRNEVGPIFISDWLLQHPNTKALAQPNGNLIFINPNQ